MGPPPVLSEDEKQVLVKWITDSSQKVFPQRKTPFKNNMPGNGWFQVFLHHYPMLST